MPFKVHNTYLKLDFTYLVMQGNSPHSWSHHSKNLLFGWKSKIIKLLEILSLIHSLIHHFDTLSSSKNLRDDNWNVAIKGLKDTDSIENIVEKGEIAFLSYFTFFQNIFLKLFFSVC